VGVQLVATFLKQYWTMGGREAGDAWASNALVAQSTRPRHQYPIY
jgi:hypothetical protein